MKILVTISCFRTFLIFIQSYIFNICIYFKCFFLYLYIYKYISREISIEHPSVGLASLAQLFATLATPTTSLRTNTSIVSSGKTLYRAAPLETIKVLVLVLHCCSALLQNLVGNSEETHLEETSRGKCRCSLSSSSNS